MVTLNGKMFAETDKEFIDSLFLNGGTCVGYAKRNKKSVTLLNMQKEKIGVINQYGVLCCATKQPDGKYWYSHATIKEIGEYSSYMRKVEECRAIVGCDLIGI